MRASSRVAIGVCGALGILVTDHGFAQSAQSGAALEEIVVTGSFIKRDSSFQPSSPVSVLEREELDARAPQTIASYLADLPFNFGSQFSSGRALGNERGGGNVNLRGLGPSATLVLLNSRRTTQNPDNPDNVVDVNSLVPEIMIERTEILKDGASALYGTDAVAGVVNFITRDRFEGFQWAARGNQATFSDKGDRRFEAMWGTKLFGGRTHLVGAIGVHDQDAMAGMPQTAPSQKGTENDIRFSSASSWPGEFVVPRRDANGALIPGNAGLRTNVVDPTCGQIVSSIPGAAAQPGMPATAAPDAASAVDCRYQFWSDNALQSEIRRYQAFVRLSHDVSDSFRIAADVGYASVDSETSYTAGDTINVPTVIPGHNPGNIFRAMNAAGEPLFAVSSGVSAGFSRDGAEVFLPLRDANGNVVLAPTPTVQSPGTIPFWEDVSYSGRPIGSQGGLPTGNTLGPGEFAWSRPSQASNDIFRSSLELSGDFNDRWSWQAAATYSKYHLATNGAVGVALTSRLNAALQGLGGPNCDPQTGSPGQGNCGYFNIFGNSAFATAPGDPRANTKEMVDWVIPLLRDTFDSSLLVGDFIVSGSLFDLPAGPLGVAAGYQYRGSTLEIDYDTAKNLGDTAAGTVFEDFDEDRSTHAAFVEFNIPLFRSGAGYMEFNGAIRHEDSGGKLQTTDPKFGLLYETPGRLLTMRASYGTSFVAPSLFRLYSASSANTAANDCAVGLHPVCTGERNLRIAAQTRGNPNLQPQSSEAYSFGVTLRPLDNLTLSLDYWHFNFEDLITTETATQLVAMDPDGSLTGRVSRDATGRVQSVRLQYFNASEMTTSGLDFEGSYAIEMDEAGRLSFNLAATYIKEYELVQSPGAAPINAVGRTNDSIAGVSPNSRLRGNFRATWANANHSLTALLRYYHPLKFTLTPGSEIDSWTPIDLTYSYRFDGDFLGNALGSQLSATLGVINVLDEEIPHVPVPGFQPFIPSLYDARGRMVWLRLTGEF
jgi:iron complex outermembrane receptor protein